MKKNKPFFLFLLLFLGNMIIYGQCSVNAGGNVTICGTSYTLQGSSGTTSGTPTWTLVSKPSGAPDPVITGVNTLTPTVTGMTSPGNYVFKVEKDCGPSGSANSQVTITAPGAITGFTAGPDITNIPASTGIANLSATIPAGYTPSWTYYNISSYEFNGAIVTTNASMTNTTTATPTLTLAKKSDHDIDPSYRVILRITSTINPSCWYEEDAIVRFIPNPNMVFPASRTVCVSAPIGSNSFYYDPDSESPKFSTFTTNSSGNPSSGTTVTMTVVSQPSGGNIQYSRMDNGRLYFTGITATGPYVFDLKIENSTGSDTTRLTYNFDGYQPGVLSFLDPAYPNQIELYTPGSSAGSVYCNRVNSTAPITFYYKLNSADSPLFSSNVTASGVIPGGVAPLIVQGGAGTLNRSATLTPPSGGWKAGTYRFTVTVTGGSGCTRTHIYYVHISDNVRPAVNVNNITVCYSGSGVVSATIPLPAVYQETTANLSYFQDFSGRYDFTLISSPAGASVPTYQAASLRSLKSTSTVISNLDKPGEYVFRIKAAGASGPQKIIDAEYACSLTSPEDTFSVFVSAQVGSNAGSAQTLIGTTQTTFNGNNPGVATGAWMLLSKPVGATDPVIATPSLYNTNVTGFNSPGTYTFRWTVTTGTGTCTSTSDLTVNVINATAGGVSGADFWVKSDDAGTIATAWKDHSANADNIPNIGGITLSPADRAHNFHPYTTGYSASKYFYNTNSVLNTTNVFTDPSMRSSVSVFSAVRPTSANGTGRITGIDDDANASEPGISINSGMPYIYKYYGNGAMQANNNTMSAANAFTVNKSSVFSAIQDQALNSGRGERRLGLDGTYESFNLGSATNTFNVLGKHLKIGYAGWDVSGAFPGDIMEILWFKRALTANEQSRVNSYLAVKNGTTLNENYLSTTSSIVWDRTNNTGYNNNIFGIARDNITALHQKQSGSTNIGQKLVISTTGFAASNSANATGLASDLQFLMSGDNGLKQSLTTPLSYTVGSNGTTNFRFESIWKVQNTNTVSTVTVAWPKGVKNLYLVQSSDAIFDGTDTFTPMATEVTVNGVVYNTANVTLANGQFYTFAGFVQAPGGVLGPDFWVKSDDAGTISTAWKDNSPNADNIPNVGGITLSPADRNHNFYPYTTGYSSTKYFHNDTSVMNPLGNVELPNTNTSIFSAVRPTSVAAGRIIGIDNDAANAAEPGVSITSVGRPRQYEFWQGTTSSDFSTAFSNGISNVYSAIANNNTANGGTSTIAGGEKRLGLNGSYESFSGFGATNKFQIYGTNLRLGYATWDVSGDFPGDIMEIAWYNRTLTANEQSRVNSYLAVKNGVTLNENYLSTNSSVVWDRTINTGYNNNIFGIAKDEFTVLNQKQAGSVNDLQKLVISTTGFADSNAANSTGLATDLQYLMTGDNGLEQKLKIPLAYTAGTNGEANHRFESIWKAQNSGNVATVTVAWPKGVKNLYLVQSPDAAFDGTDTFTPMATEITVNGVVYNTANVTLGNGQYFTFAGFVGDYCITGCNDNTFLNATDPNTIEYDNLIASENAIIAKEKDGTFNIWGYRTGPTSIPSNVNVLIDLLTPTAITPANGFNYTGTPLKAALADNGTISSALLLTTDGLYGWGERSVSYTKTTNNANPRFGKITINGKTDGLPPGVSPTDVKMIFQTYLSLTIVTCKGEAWTMSGHTSDYAYGDGTPYSAANNLIWHRAKISATETLDNVVAVRGSTGVKFALTSEGKLYTWGQATYIGDGTDPAGGTHRAFATQVVVPAGVTPKMIGMTAEGAFVNHTYFLLGTNGRLYAMGNNGNYGMLGDGTTTDSKVWKEVTATSGSHTLGGNIVWISPGEHGSPSFPAINVLTSDKKQWGWGSNSGYKLGQSSTTGSYLTPIYMPGNTTNANGMGLNDEIIAVETGHAFTMNYKKTSQYFGFVGNTEYGTIGNGSTGIANHTKYTYNTGLVDICGLLSSGACYKPGITAGTALDTKVGITALNRAGATDSDNWPMTRKGGWLALEAKTKGFVPNRVAFDASGNPIGISAANFVEGMMVYDTTNKCLKMYTLKDGDTSMAWHCISTQTCPD